MTLSDLAPIGTVVSAVAVLVSLFLLNLQVRQSAKHQRALVQQGRAARSVDIAMRLMGAEFAGVYSRCMKGDAGVSETQLVQFMGYCRAVFLGAEDSYLQHRVSLLDELAFESTSSWSRRIPMTTQLLDGNAADRPTSASVRKSRPVWSSNPAVVLWGTMVGKKIVMAVTGLVLVGFVIAHMLGNLKIFLGAEAIDAYAVFLRTMGEPMVPYGMLLWVVRIVLLACVAVHITAAVQLTRMNWAARPRGYLTKQSIATTYAARTMRWSGVILALFVVYHLLHLTGGAVGFQPGEFVHLLVYHNVVAGFSVWYVSLFYILAMAALCLHLDHGIWSMFQTLGLNNARTTSALQTLSRVVALVVFVGFTSVPVAVLAGWVR